MPIRPRRNRKTEAIRSMIRETTLQSSNLILPVFVCDGKGVSDPIASMPGQSRLSIDRVVTKAKEAHALGIPAIALFPKIEDSKKDSLARESTNAKGLLPRAVTALKAAVPEMMVITDVAMDPYSSDGHDGIVRGGEILNDETLEVLGAMAITQVEAGADWVAPSDMMDGRVGYLRSTLDRAGYTGTGILAYSAKYASSFYGPFRDALQSAPKSGDKKTYQMDPANRREALREARLDELEGADALMVKPALPYLDVLAAIRRRTTLPLAAYQVSGEYAMICAAGQNGWIDTKLAMLESLTAIRRAGADMILTYFAIEAARELE